VVGIGEALERLFSLIDRFMAKDRDSGFQPEPIRVGSLIADVRLHFGMTGRGERLAFTVDDDAVSLFADHEMLATVLIDLIDNALKYSRKDQPVDVDVGRDCRCVVVKVRDRGIGIPQAELHKIGRRFFRASNTTAGTGTGLGLYTSRKLLAYHDGTLQLLANEDRGITAIVRLPLSEGMADRRMPEELTA
jgi:signal transduction histidine kinase